VYGIIKMHRGQITVNSQVGQGTTFTVILPIMLSDHQVPHNNPQAEFTL
jgi:signal transduction histidine kinase